MARAMARPAVTVIIPTIADEQRGRTIWRALHSVTTQRNVDAKALIVVNGSTFSSGLVARLERTSGVEVLRIGEAGMPAAMYAGRCRLRTEFFGVLDDDDELLDEALECRAEFLRSSRGMDFVISNGVLSVNGMESPAVEDVAAIRRDPVMALTRFSWFVTSASGLFCSARIGPELLARTPKYLEWTYLGFKLLMARRGDFLDSPMYRKHDVAESVSRSQNYRLGMVEAIERVLELPLPPIARQEMFRKLSAAHHDQSNIHLVAGTRGKALLHHLKSLALPGGLRYLSSSRRFLG